MTASIQRAACLLAMAVLLAGCARKESSPGAGNGGKVSEGPAMKGPGNTPAAAAQRDGLPERFWIEYPFEPSGRRDWKRVGEGKWEEHWTDGTVMKYTEIDPRYDAGGVTGTIVRRDDKDHDVLIPHAGKGAILRVRPAAGGRYWNLLAPIQGVE